MHTHIRIKLTLMLQLIMGQPVHHGTKPLLELIITYVFILGIYIYSVDCRPIIHFIHFFTFHRSLDIEIAC